MSRANAKNATARATAQKKKKRDGQEQVNQIGEHYQAEFRRIAKEKGVSDKKLEELDHLHTKEGSQEKLLHALQTLMVGEDLECVSVAEELANQVGLDTALFEEMTAYAANNSIEFENVCVASTEDAASTAHSETWKTALHWEPAKNITEQLERPDGEGMETFRCAKEEVDHMRDTGGVITVNRQDPEVQKELKTAGPLDSKWVIARKMMKCPKTARLIFSRLRLRLTLRGFRQRAGLQFDPHVAFAPVMHLGALMLLLTIAILFKLHIRLADDSKAFCEGVMDYKLYCFVPKPFCDIVEYAPHGPKNTLWLLVSAIYGVKQAARQYFSEVISYCTDKMQMIQSQRDPCVLIRWFTRQEANRYSSEEIPALSARAHIDGDDVDMDLPPGLHSQRSNRGSGRKDSSARNSSIYKQLIAFLLMGA